MASIRSLLKTAIIINLNDYLNGGSMEPEKVAQFAPDRYAQLRAD
jgi:hypothetical protein